MKRKFRIQICSIKMLYSMLDNNEINHPVAAVLCSEYPVKIQEYKNVKYLHIAFEDITEKSYGRKFTPKLAETVRWFVENVDEGITDLFFCCNSGESRSSALAAAYMRYYGMDEMSVWKNPRYHPNPLVYKLQCKALGKPVSAIGVKYRTYISKQALAKAINRARKNK